MALIKCPECGKIFSDRAAHCPQCGLPTSDALEMITNATEAQPEAVPQPAAEPVAAPAAQSAQPTAPPAIERSAVTPPYAAMPEVSRERSVQPKKQRNLLTYILIVAVIVLAIVCIALVFTTSGIFNSDTEEVEDTVATMQTLPPDTTPARVEVEPEVKPVIRTEVAEEIPAESEEIEINTPEPAAAAPEPAPEPVPAPEPSPTE